MVGCAKLCDVRKLTDDEKGTLFGEYNNIIWDDWLIYTESTCHLLLKRNGRLLADAIYPMDYGYFFSKVHRFKKPFVSPVQHMFGPIGNIPLYPEIARQLPTWAKKLIR